MIHVCFAPCESGLEEVLAAELGRLGATEIRPARRGVGFQANTETMWRANLELRCANRVLRQLAVAPVKDREALYAMAHEIEWERVMGPEQTLAIDCRTNHRALHQPQFVSQLVKDAICDRLRRVEGARPSVERVDPDIPIAVHLSPTHATISLDTSGMRLHRRGYRTEAGEAPLKETLAAGMLALAGWTGDVPLLDPMCGSGTIAIEAALIATDTAPGLLRIGGEGFAFERWRGHDREAFARLVAAARERRHPATVPIVARDVDKRLLKMARANAGRAAVSSAVRFEPGHAGRMQPPCEPGTLVSNPPYGERLGEREEILELMGEVGSILKHRFAGWTAWLLLGDREQLGAVGLRPSARVTLFNGPLECRFARFDLYAGSRRRRDQEES